MVPLNNQRETMGGGGVHVCFFLARLSANEFLCGALCTSSVGNMRVGCLYLFSMCWV
jgi:hypothetical protein